MEGVEGPPPPQRGCEGPVYFHDAYFGAAPVTLPAAQVRRLVRPGDIIVNEKKSSAVAAGVVWNASGSITLSAAGRYRILATRRSDKSSLRNAQYLCGVFGLIIINMILFFDSGSRLANIKDFAINFASDILAVGSVLLLAEWVDEWRKSGKAFQEPDPHELENDDDEDIYRRPLQSAL